MAVVGACSFRKEARTQVIPGSGLSKTVRLIPSGDLDAFSVAMKRIREIGMMVIIR
jgi:hypothetical protein